MFLYHVTQKVIELCLDMGKASYKHCFAIFKWVQVVNMKIVMKPLKH